MPTPKHYDAIARALYKEPGYLSRKKLEQRVAPKNIRTFRAALKRAVSDGLVLREKQTFKLASVPKVEPQPVTVYVTSRVDIDNKARDACYISGAFRTRYEAVVHNLIDCTSNLDDEQFLDLFFPNKKETKLVKRMRAGASDRLKASAIWKTIKLRLAVGWVDAGARDDLLMCEDMVSAEEMIELLQPLREHTTHTVDCFVVS